MFMDFLENVAPCLKQSERGSSHAVRVASVLHYFRYPTTYRHLREQLPASISTINQWIHEVVEAIIESPVAARWAKPSSPYVVRRYPKFRQFVGCVGPPWSPSCDL